MLFCEGEATEGGWITYLNRRFPNVGGVHQYVGEAKRTAEAAIDIRSQRRPRGEPSPEVWIVVDRDNHDLSTVLAPARDAGVGLVFSNPCFELWALLHLESHTRRERRGALQTRLGALDPSYDHDRGAQFDWDTHDPQQAAALRRALALHRRAIDPTTWTGSSALGDELQSPKGALQNPTTTAWLLHLRYQHAATLDSGAPLAADHPLVGALRDSGHPGELVTCLPEPHRSRAQAALDTPTATR